MFGPAAVVATVNKAVNEKQRRFGLLILVFLFALFPTSLYNIHQAKEMNIVSTKNETQVENVTTYLQHHFRECVAPPGGGIGRQEQISLEASGQYISSDNPPRYDHTSCFAMKARYNCASVYNATSTEKVATDYKLVWNYANHTKDCDVRRVVDTVGGPQGFARLLGRTNHTRPFQVLLQGNSYLRQIFEALVCGFQSQITDLKVQVGGPRISKSNIEARKGRLPGIGELGDMIDFSRAKEGGCHGGTSIAKFYRRNVTVPPTTPDCNDNLGMVEFGNVIRFYYIFGPSMYSNETLHQIYDKLGVRGDSVDVLYFNVNESKTSLAYERKVDYSSLLSTLRILQRRDVGTYFGANNPWITDPPDGHPCMPGIPDDEVNVLLFLLLGEYGIKGRY
jgi:hypothetical protein